MKKSQKSQSVVGNTKLPPRARRWCFTLNNWTEEDKKGLEKAFLGENYIIGEEIGEEKKISHLQGYVEFKNQKVLEVLKKINNKIHWEKCRGNREQNIAYCSKGGITFGNLVKKKLKIIEELKDWQREVVEITNQEPDDRKILWYVDIEGNKGKTALCKYLVVNKGALYLTGKCADIKYGITQYITEKNIVDCPPILMDFTRDVEEYVSYQAIEAIKNGIFYNTKYESKMITYNSPHVIIFANFFPDITKLSSDRWVIRELV